MDDDGAVAPVVGDSAGFEVPNENPKVGFGVPPNGLEATGVELVVGAEVCAAVVAPNKLEVFS